MENTHKKDHILGVEKSTKKAIIERYLPVCDESCTTRH